MRDVFTNTPNYTPYTHLPNNIPLNQLTKQQTADTATKKLQVAWQKESAKMFARPQKADSADSNVLNHAIWYATKGFNTPYPGERLSFSQPSETVSLPPYLRRLVTISMLRIGSVGGPDLELWQQE